MPTMTMQRPMTLLEIVQETVFQSPDGVKGIAEFLGKAPSTLYSEINPNDADGRTHKLGLLDWVRVLKLTGDGRSLAKVCQDLGHVAVPLPTGEPSPRDALAHLGRIGKEAGEHALEVCRALEDDRIDRAEARRCLAECDELIRAAVTWRRALEDMI